jgi:prolyl 4-hydroxylase
MEGDPLEARAREGEIDALLELGARHEARCRINAARGCFAAAAKAGSIAGLRLLAINLLTQEPVEAESGVNMIRAAADKGDAEAALVCANLAAGDIELPDRASVARRCLEIAAERGAERACEQLAFLDEANVEIDVLSLPRREVSQSPRISIIEGFATKAECEWIIRRSRPHLQRASVYNPESGGFFVKEVRTNSSVEFGIARADVVIMGMRLRIQGLTGLHRLELSSILHYAPGQEFTPHFDFLDPALPGHALDIQRSGQRAATCLIYLNDGYEGGETEFVKLGWRFKGKPGDALLFWNLLPSGAPDHQTMHAGLPPTSGEKWLFSQWLRQEP